MGCRFRRRAGWEKIPNHCKPLLPRLLLMRCVVDRFICTYILFVLSAVPCPFTPSWHWCCRWKSGKNDSSFLSRCRISDHRFHAPPFNGHHNLLLLVGHVSDVCCPVPLHRIFCTPHHLGTTGSWAEHFNTNPAFSGLQFLHIKLSTVVAVRLSRYNRNERKTNAPAWIEIKRS